MKVEYAFDAESDSEMSISVGEIVAVIEEVDPGWFIGEIVGEEQRSGMFPATYCIVIETTQTPSRRTPLKPPSPAKEVSDMEEQVSNLSIRRPGGIRPNMARTVSAGSSTSTSPAKKKPPPPPVSRGTKPSVTAAVTIDAKCRECGCTEFRANVFKKGSCNNCFHVHLG
jgi:hypothetical protein